jgi:hypothetical protein
MYNQYNYFNIFKTYLLKPKIAFTIFTIFVISYLIILNNEGAFTESFLKFGPSSETKFLSMHLDTWTKVITVYFVGFFSTLITTYYQNVTRDKIYTHIWNPALLKKIPLSKSWTHTIVSIEPILFWILSTINFFIDLTMQLQFILPKFLGSIIIDIPYNLYKTNQKKFKN